MQNAQSLRFLKHTFYLAATAWAVISTGCGTTTQRSGTEQLLLSDAVDNAVAKLEFSELSGHKVFFDTSFLESVRSNNFISEQYVVSAIRHQLTAAGALVQESREDAETIVEARVGALGTDGHEITYGIPKTGGLSAAASVLSSSPVSLPEISFAQTDSHAGIAKVIVFAYDQESKDPVWQSGVARAESSCSHTWVLGAGPFEKGSIYEGRRFAGQEIPDSTIAIRGSVRKNKNAPQADTPRRLSYLDPHRFPQTPAPDEATASDVVLASAEEEIVDGAPAEAMP